VISNDLENNSNECDNIDYWIKDLQSIKVDESSILLDLNRWLSGQYLGSPMQILYVEKLQSLGYEQHTYAIIGKKCTCIKKCLQHIFINNDHLILVKIHMSTPNLHYKIYDSHMPMMKKLPSDTIQLLCKLINVNNLLYTNANVMQQIDNSSCGVFTIAYATYIAFGFDPEKSQYVLTQMQTNLQNSLNNTINNKYVFPFPKYELI
jgi:hypothetical protein